MHAIGITSLKPGLAISLLGGEQCILEGWSWISMLFKMTFLTTFISIIKLYNQICQIFIFLNLMNKLKIMIFNFMTKYKKSGLVPPALYYCGRNAKKIGPKKSLLKICTLHTPYPLHYTLKYLTKYLISYNKKSIILIKDFNVNLV